MKGRRSGLSVGASCYDGIGKSARPFQAAPRLQRLRAALRRADPLLADILSARYPEAERRCVGRPGVRIGGSLKAQEPPAANGSWHGAEVLEVHGQVFIGPPVAFHPEWPLFMYFASKPASRSLMAVLQPTWKP